MPKKNDTYLPKRDHDDTVILDDTDATYTFLGRAPRQEVKNAAVAGGESDAIWYITRTTKVDPFKTEQAAPQYSQVWADRLTIATFI